MHETTFTEMGRLLPEQFKEKWNEHLKLLDVGSRAVNRSFRHTYRECVSTAWSYVGSDTESGKNVDLVQTGPYLIQPAPGAFDIVISGQCLEHVPNPFRLVNEMTRHLVDGGTMILCAPWVWEIHPYPIDCWRILPDGMKALFEDAGLKTVKTYTNQQDCWGIAVK